MVNSIIDGISIKLNETFGDTYAIYSEEVDQNFTEKCFFIEILNPMIRPFVGDRHLRVHPFNIRFFPIENNNKTAQILDVADELTQCLKYITVNGDLVRGVNMQYNIVDDVLHFIVEFNIIANCQREIDPMEDLTIDEHVKG